MFFLTSWAIPIFILLIVGSFQRGNFEDHNTPSKIVESINSESIPVQSVTPNLTPTITISPSPITSPTDIETPAKPKITEIPQVRSGIIESDITAGDIPLQLMEQINHFRAGKGLPAFTTDGYTCSFAVTRASEITVNFNHDGFRNRIDNKILPYPSFTGISENIAINSDSNSVVQGWINSPGHNENLSKQHAHACVGKNGNYYTFESWNP